jgi:hypothetical protein
MFFKIFHRFRQSIVLEALVRFSAVGTVVVHEGVLVFVKANSGGIFDG